MRSLGHIQSIVGFCVCYRIVVEYCEMHYGDVTEYYYVHNMETSLTIPCGNTVKHCKQTL